MRTEGEIKKQLEEVYEHRLRLRVERKMKRMCRNCRNGVSKEFDLGDFGTVARWECRDGMECGESCRFACRCGVKEIEDEMLKDISDPSVCGAKEPKIAVLLWMLHDSGLTEAKETDENPDVSVWGKIKRIFS